MIRIHILVEGQTEETFVRDVLSPYFALNNKNLTWTIVETSRGHRGGVTSYAKIKPQIDRACKQSSNPYVTTMFDLFRLPNDFPGMDSIPNGGDGFVKASHLEQALGNDIGCRRFIPNLMVHEFEALLYSDPDKFSNWFPSSAVQTIQSDRNRYDTPEHINEGAMTSPSKRLERCCRGYEKPIHGTLISMDIGLDRIRAECKHFNAWIDTLLALVDTP